VTEHEKGLPASAEGTGPLFQEGLQEERGAAPALRVAVCPLWVRTLALVEAGVQALRDVDIRTAPQLGRGGQVAGGPPGQGLHEAQGAVGAGQAGHLDEAPRLEGVLLAPPQPPPIAVGQQQGARSIQQRKRERATWKKKGKKGCGRQEGRSCATQTKSAGPSL
jgi:hypothetical protein